MLAKDVVFTTMATGEETRGPEAVEATLRWLYHVAFDATVDTRLMLFGEQNALMEGYFVGKHTGEFAGIPATGKEVRVPMVVIYDLENDLITRARIYFETPALLAQLGMPLG